jgi:4-carboxymuconolactone decarboxylase
MLPHAGDAFGDFAPERVRYVDEVLFDQVWERDGLSRRDRSLIMVTALIAMGKPDQLRFHSAMPAAPGSPKRS